MKIIISFLATAFLAAMTFAQEESASPAESTAPTTEEKASATVEETPAAKAKEATAPAAEKKAEAATSPATAKKEATTATTAKPAAAAASASPSGKNMSVKDMENAWEAAVGSHNVATVEGFVAADFVGVSSKGKFVNRSQVLSEYKADKDTYKSAKNEKLNVKMFGPNVTVVAGRAREVGTGKDGKAFDRTFLFTDTWMMRGGNGGATDSASIYPKGRRGRSNRC